MGFDLYTLRKKGIVLHSGDGGREKVNLLQLVVANALAQDVQQVVDLAIKNAYKEWENVRHFPGLVVQAGIAGMPRAGAPIFKWSGKRVYCFDDDLLKPVGYLGTMELGGFAFRTVEEQTILDDLATARGIDEGSAKVYRDFWGGETFQSGEEFLAYRRGFVKSQNAGGGSTVAQQAAHQSRLNKILSLIKHIEIKGRKASNADVQYLNCLRQKAVQLGYSFQ